MKRLLWLLPLAALTAGCNPNQAWMPYLGKWNGRFLVDQITQGPNTAEDRQRYMLEGWLQVYATGQKYRMELNGEQVTVSISGTWRLERNAAVFRATEIKIDDKGGEDARNPNLKYIPNEAIKATYGQPLILRLGKDDKSLRGLLITLGPLIGAHEFERV